MIPHTKKEIKEDFFKSCKEGDIEKMKYYISSPSISFNVDIFSEHSKGLSLACEYGHLDIVRYLVSNPELRKKCSIFSNSNRCLEISCMNGHVDIVQYLLTSDELDKNICLTDNDIWIFKNTVKNNQVGVINYVLNDNQIKTQSDKKIDNVLADIEKYCFQKAMEFVQISVIEYLLIERGVDKKYPSLLESEMFYMTRRNSNVHKHILSILNSKNQYKKLDNLLLHNQTEKLPSVTKMKI